MGRLTSGVQDTLQVLLRSLLQTYFELVCDLLRPIQPFNVWVPSTSAPQTLTSNAEPQNESNSQNEEAQGHWVPSSHLKEHLRHVEMVVINFQYRLNQLRPLQARAALEDLLREQLEQKRQATALLRKKCAAIRDELKQLEL